MLIIHNVCISSAALKPIGGCAKRPIERYVDRSAAFVEGFNELGLDGLIAIGGDGSMQIINRLCQQGDIPWIGIPKTIDNDVPGTEHAVGFSTAVGVCVDVVAVPIAEVVARGARALQMDNALLKTARGLGIYVGVLV